MGLRRLSHIFSILAHHITLTAHYIKHMLQTITELMIYMLLTNTTAQNTYVKHNQKRLPKLYKFLLKWKFNIARLNEEIDIYYKRNYKVVDYLAKKPNLRVSEITRTPYGYRKWKRRQRARLNCILYKPVSYTHLTLPTKA